MDIKVEICANPRRAMGFYFQLPAGCSVLPFLAYFSVSSSDFLSPHLLSNFLFYLHSLASFVTAGKISTLMPGGEKAGWVDWITPLPSSYLCCS